MRKLIALVSVLVVAALNAPAVPVEFGFAKNISVSLKDHANEPSGITSADRARWISYQSSTDVVRLPVYGSKPLATGFRSFDAAGSDRDAGDVTMAADNAGTVFLAHLAGALQTDIDYSTDHGSTWQRAVAPTGQRSSDSAQPLAVDRPWIAAYSPSRNAADTKVYLEYHDFGPDAMWMQSCSMASGSLVCGAGFPISGTESFCNTIPGPFQVSPPGSAHPGRVYAVWITADPQTNVTGGCNITELEPFYKVMIAYSDNPDAGAQATWKIVQVFSGPPSSKCTPRFAPVATSTCDDNGVIFPGLAIDKAGTAYVTWSGYIDTIDPHYDVYVSSSPDGEGWSPPRRVDRSPGIEVMPAIVAGDAGRIAIAWVGTPFDTQPFLTSDPCPSGTPPQFTCAGKKKAEPTTAPWNVFTAFSLDGGAHFTIARTSDKIMHYGDFCNVGIYCDGSATGNRSLADNITIFLDLGGYVQVAWTDQRRLGPSTGGDQSAQNASNQIWLACQNTGASLFVHPAFPPSCARPAPAKRRR